MTDTGIQIGPDTRPMETAQHDELLAAFEARTLPADRFDHRGHLRMAWLYLRRHGWPDGAVRFMAALRAYVTHLGATQKYHETITWAYLVLLNEELTLRSPPAESFEQLLERRPELRTHRGGPLFRLYTAAQLEGDDARRVFVLPGR